MFRPGRSPHSVPRPLRAPLYFTALLVLALSACSESPGPIGGSGGATGSGGAGGSGGAVGSGGATASGGAVGSGGAASTGGGSSGGAASGGAASGGAASGGAASGGSTGSGGGGAGSGGGGATEFALTVEGVDALDNSDCDHETKEPCPLYPEDNTSFGTNVSPAMEWTAGPEGTLSYAMTLIDRSNTVGGTLFAHWAIWDIPAATLELPAELPAGGTLTTPVMAKQASGIGQMEEYFGSGACGNVYELRLYALGTATLDPADPANPATVVDALEALTPLGQTFVRMQSRDYCP